MCFTSCYMRVRQCILKQATHQAAQPTIDEQVAPNCQIEAEQHSHAQRSNANALTLTAHSNAKEHMHAQKQGGIESSKPSRMSQRCK